ncbi:hypothetical protein Ciccas_010899 [Cichlidogyrus casuarinus]|uniref:Leucine-rich repeat-containing protein 47 n=1 Tax=Cichlidogyrus casuarinus TaxID=1844966 RepID=A0ABD2PXH0_9PLAT
MSAEWVKVSKALSGKQLEISLSGDDINSTLNDDNTNFDRRLFTIKGLNCFKLTSSNLTTIPQEFGNFDAMLNLCLMNNKISSLPASIGRLTKLKNLDLSANCLTKLPEDFFKSLHNLESLNLNNNLLSSLPDLAGLVNLHHMQIAHNQLVSIPDSLGELVKLLTLNAANNELELLPLSIGKIEGMKTLRLENNRLLTLPQSFSRLSKLSDLSLQNNSFKGDRKLKKLSDPEKPVIKSLLVYAAQLRDGDVTKSKAKKEESEEEPEPESNNIPPIEVEMPAPEAKNSKKKKKSKSAAVKEDDEGLSSLSLEDERVPDAFVKIEKPAINPENYVIRVEHLDAVAKSLRPQLVACVVRNVCFHGSQNLLKKFLKYQEELHQSLGGNRENATIATHDMTKFQLPLTFALKHQQDVRIHALHRKEECSVQELVTAMRREADEFRKAKKRNQLCGIHKYLKSVTPTLPTLTDAEGLTMSVAPLTNCHDTRVRFNLF